MNLTEFEILRRIYIKADSSQRKLSKDLNLPKNLIIYEKTKEYKDVFFKNRSDKDINLIDLKGPIGVSNNIWKAAAYCRKIENGKVFSYAVAMFTGIVIFVSLIFF